MKKLISISLSLLLSVCSTTAFAKSPATWSEVNKNRVPTDGARKIFPTEYKVYSLQDGYMKSLLFQLNEGSSTIIELPGPDGVMQQYKVWPSSVMHPQLAAKYPGIKSFTATNVTQPNITAKINYTYKGFNAMVYNGNNTYLVDPYTNSNEGYYICYYQKDRAVNHNGGFSCGDLSNNDNPDTHNAIEIGTTPPTTSALITNGTVRRKFALALTCTGEYAVAIDGPSPSKPNVISAMATSLSRINGILERELSMTMELVANNDTLVYLDPTTDPFTTIQNNNVSASTLAANQVNTDNIIGNASYDLGHVFCTGANGVAFRASVCETGNKARGATGSANPVGDAFDVNYVIHEIGHQLGADHTFNGSGSACSGNGRASYAYEPGSATTIMGYAGICGMANDIQANSDDYFHARSLDDMTQYMNSIPACGVSTVSTNIPPVVADIRAEYNVPMKTPFELEAPLATDFDNDAITYCWEQYDLGDFGKTLSQTQLGPIVRSFKPDTSRWRIFPTLDSIKRGVNSYLAEKTPELTRDMNFRLTVRDILNGWGTYNWSDTTLTLHVTDQAGPFLITGGVNSDTTYWRNGSTQTITWDVANTTAAPVSCSNVDILLSLDYGRTWPITLAANTPNDGSEQITVPATPATFGAYIKIKAVGNVFFDISNAAFAINDWPVSVQGITRSNEILVYPIPAKDILNISTGPQNFNVVMHNSIGQLVYSGNIDGEFQYETNINIANLAAGVYYLTFTDIATGNKSLKRIAIQ